MTTFAMTTDQLAHHCDKEGFQNTQATSTGGLFGALKSWLVTKREMPAPKHALPVRTISKQELIEQQEPTLYRLGHSSVLIKMDGELILTDPVFSERASPSQLVGPKRFHPVPLSLEDLPNIKAVIISHDHYDHLDKHTVLELADKVEHFVMPLKVGNHLRNWGVADEKIIELDWWQGTALGSLTITATPSQHFSGRSLTDRDETLWASFVIAGTNTNLFFSGDSGYFDGFKEIGERFGPFDITMIETGAYNDAWSDIHMLPEQSVQAHIDLQGKAMLPIHNSTFDLSLHDWNEPLERAAKHADEHNVELLTPIFGEAVPVHSPKTSYAWWRQSTDLEMVTSPNNDVEKTQDFKVLTSN